MFFFFKDTPELQIKSGNLSQSADRGANETESLLLKRNFFILSEREGGEMINLSGLLIPHANGGEEGHAA